jgi:hypothetical protein
MRFGAGQLTNLTLLWCKTAVLSAFSQKELV